MSSEASGWKSLFLPLGAEERVIFASFVTQVRAPFNALHVVNDCDTQREAILCVMENQSVCIFDMTSSTEGPKKASSFHAPKEMKSQAGDEKVVATCASLIPLELAFACHHHHNVTTRLQMQDDDAYEPPVAVSTTDEEMRDASRHPTIFRGVVGSSNGRVDVFMDNSYAFGFPAHKCPVVHVQALYVGDSAMPASPAPDDRITPNQQASTVNTHPVHRDTFAAVTTVLGFVTMGADGVVFIWRRRSEGFRREKLVEPSFLSKCHAIHAVLPCKSTPLQMATLLREEAPVASGPEEERDSPAAPLYSPAAASNNNSVSIPFSSATASHQPPGYRVAPSLIVSGGNGFSNTIKVRSCESMKEVEDDLELEGMFARTTAIAVDGPTCLVAREKVVYCIDYLARTCKRIFTTTSCVTKLVLHSPFAVAGCESGKVYVVHSTQGTVLGTTYTYSAAPVVSLSFVRSALLVAVVDATYCVEVIELPEEYLRQQASNSACVFDPQQSAAADALQKYVVLQECSTGGGSAAVARSSVAEEQLLLARFLVPEEVTKYLRKAHRLA